MADKEKRLRMKTIKETFKAEKEILDGLFKNRISFKCVEEKEYFQNSHHVEYSSIYLETQMLKHVLKNLNH